MNNIQDGNTIKPNQPTVGIGAGDKDSIHKTRPTIAQKSKKDFRKMIDSENQPEIASLDREDEGENLPSLFDLTKKKTNEKANLKNLKQSMGQSSLLSKEIDEDSELASELENIDEQTDVSEANTKSRLFSEKPIKTDSLAMKKRFEIPNQPALPSDDDMIAASEEQTILHKPIRKTENTPIQFFQENKKEELATKKNKMRSPTDENAKQDIAYGTPITQSIFAIEKGNAEQKDVHNSYAMRQIIDKVVDAIQVIEKKGTTETVVSLRYPPILEGATLTLTTTDRASKEFNIAFSSLTEAAKSFLDQRLAKDSLTNSLEQQGFIVNSLITTTAKEITINPDSTLWNQYNEENPKEQREHPSKNDEQQE